MSVLLALGLVYAFCLPLPLGAAGALALVWLLVLFPLLSRCLLWSPSALLALELKDSSWFLRLRDGRQYSLNQVQLWGRWLILSAEAGHWLISAQSVSPSCWSALRRFARGYSGA